MYLRARVRSKPFLSLLKLKLGFAKLFESGYSSLPIVSERNKKFYGVVDKLDYCAFIINIFDSTVEDLGSFQALCYLPSTREYLRLSNVRFVCQPKVETLQDC